VNETTVLSESHRDRVWRSTLTGSTYRWNEKAGWELEMARYTGEGMFRPVRAGVVTETVYAHAQEKFVEVPNEKR
jgi:hypothetical protein